MPAKGSGPVCQSGTDGYRNGKRQAISEAG
jgi:hypothetical protein